MTLEIKPTPEFAICPHCGEGFKKLSDGGNIPTHDFPKPCRQVCRGSGQPPKSRNDTPLWKDDPEQESRDFYESARNELRIYGFAVIKQMAEFSQKKSGFMECPLCLKSVRYSVASNGHCHAYCETENCIRAME